jgi:glycosyltransferase involved in cell wall biosynthesis
MLSKPKIAILIDWYLPGTKAGGPVRSVYSLVHLLKEEFDFYIITSNKDLGETEAYKDVKSDSLIQENGVHVYYFSVNNLTTDNLLSLFEKINPELIYLNSFWSTPFSVNIIRLKNKGLLKQPVLLAPRGMLGKGALGLKSFKKSVYLRLANLLGWYSHIPFHATQEQEKKDILKKFRQSNVFIAPNINALPASVNTSIKTSHSLKLFYLSRIARVKNLHFAIELLKDVPSTISIVYDIYGNLEDADYWTECKELIKQLPKNIQVNYKGELPFHQIQITLVGYNALFLPTLNENFGHSIVESLLCGCPVVISDQTPWNDLEANEAGFAIALNNKQKFIDSLIYLAELNQETFSQKSNKAIQYINNKIDLNAIAGQYKTMFNECIQN